MGLLVAATFAVVGCFAWRREGPPQGLEAGPYWLWAWAVLLAAGVSTELSHWASPRIGTSLLSPVFSGLLVAGALRYSSRDIPKALWLATLAVGGLRLALYLFGLPNLEAVVSLVVEPAAAAVCAVLVHRAASRAKAGWPHRLLVPGFVALVVAEAAGPLEHLSGSEWIVMWPLWLAAGIPVGALQMLVRVDAAARSQGDRAVAQAGLQQADERFRWLAALTHDIIAELGPDERILWVSDNVRERLGVEPGALIGRRLCELLIHGRMVSAIGGASRAKGEGPPAPGVYGVRDREGRQRWFEIQPAASPVAREARRVFVGREVTREVEAQEAIRASEERFRTFSLLGSDYCYIASGELGGTVDHWVTGRIEEISGYSHEELMEMGFAGFIHPDDLEPGRERVMALLRDGGESSHEFRMLTRSGETRWIAERILIEREDRRFRIYGAARDVTEERHLQQALARTQRLDGLGLLAGGIAHDFNNLLTTILGNVDLGLASLAPDAEARPFLESSVEAVEQAAMLTSQLLAYAGRGAVSRIPVDLSERVQSVSELLSAGRGHAVEVSLDLATGLPAVLADPGELQQLVMNLVLNAVEACEARGHVRVTTRRASEWSGDGWLVGAPSPAKEYVALEVSDDGVGMTPETLEKVFDPFYSTKATGRGLGLAAVTGIVRGIEGGISVSSRPGEGTTFSVYLQASDKPAEPVPARQEERPAVAGRLLVVDDDESVRKVAARILRRRGYEVRTAADGRSALELFESEDFDAVILDALMPGMSGATTFEAMRRIHPEAIVLMASGFDRESVVEDLVDHGLAGFIAKPFRAAELADRIGELLAPDREPAPD